MQHERSTAVETMISAAVCFSFQVRLIVPAGLASCWSASSKHKRRVCVLGQVGGGVTLGGWMSRVKLFLSCTMFLKDSCT